MSKSSLSRGFTAPERFFKNVPPPRSSDSLIHGDFLIPPSRSDSLLQGGPYFAPSSSDSLLQGENRFYFKFKPFLVGNTPVCRKRENEHSGQEKSMKWPKTLEFDDGQCDGMNSFPKMVDRALSASNIQRDLKQPVAPPSEAKANTVALPFFKSPRRLSDNLCLFFSAYNVLDEVQRSAFCKGNIDYPEGAFLDWAKSNPYIQNRLQIQGNTGYSHKELYEYLRHLLECGHIKSYLWKNLSKWNRIPGQLLYGEKLVKYPAVIVAGMAPSSIVRESMLKKLRRLASACSELPILERHKESVREYTQISQGISWTSGNSCAHAIGVRRIGAQSYIFDTGRKSAVKLNDVADLAWSLGSCCDWHAFDISV